MKLSRLFLLSASSVFAAGPSLEQRLWNLEEQIKDVRMKTVYGNVGAKTATAKPASGPYRPLFFGELLYWKPFEGGTEFAFSIESQSPLTSNIEQFNFDRQFGYRIGALYHLSDPDWQLSADFTHIRFDQPNSVNQTVTPSGLPNSGEAPSVKARWQLSFNVLDIELGRAYFTRSHFSLHPIMGVRLAKISQIDNAVFSTGDFLKNTNHYLGAGLIGGNQIRWHWNRNWSLFSSLQASLLYGKFQVDAKGLDLDAQADTFKLLPNASLDAGLQWEIVWRALHFSLAAGYEFQYWWRQNQRFHLKSDTSYSWIHQAEDLGFQGYKLCAAFDF